MPFENECTQALEMVNAFVSVGVDRFDVIHTDIDQQLRGCRMFQSVHDVQTSIPYLVPSSYRRQNNLIIRPRKLPGKGILAQLDDVNREQVELVRRFTFLVLETSPERYQAWICIDGGSREMVRQLVNNVGADPRASGAVRLAGTRNYKRKYEPDFPIVDAFGIQKLCNQPGPLEELGLIDIPEPPWPKARRRYSSNNSASTRKWPEYWRALLLASPKPDGSGRDRSQADFLWCLWSIERGWTVEEVAAQLVVVSEKAQEESKRGNRGYARVTAWKAAKTVEAH